ncbi:MAG: alpha/beta hydrolase [Tepidisphaeraceae bacterium]|jgi:acetyl esterase/lipase
MYSRRVFFRVAILLLAIAATGCNRFAILDATIPSGGYLRETDLAYGPLPRQKLDVYQPRHVTAQAPVVIFFYGGDWQNGEKGNYRFVAEALTSRGFVAVLPDYRLYPDVTFPAFVEDGALAVRWVHDHIAAYHGNPACLFLMGHSAGAHIVALLTLDKRYLQQVGLDRSAITATAGLSGPYDFIPSPDDRPVFGMSPEDLKTNPDMEPITFTDGSAPPMLLIHGLADGVVDPANSQRLAEKISKSGGSVCYRAYRNVDHAGVVLSLAWPFRWIAPTLWDVTDFFARCENKSGAKLMDAHHDGPPSRIPDSRAGTSPSAPQ